MNDLAIIKPEQLPANLSVAEMQSALGYEASAKSAGTLLAYESDWKDFAGWCASREACPLPAHPGTVADYLSSLADAGKKASTIGRRAAAICHFHRQEGIEPPPTSHAKVKNIMRGIRNTIGTAPVQKEPATADIMARMLAGCADTMIGRRDRALLALGFAGALRRSELCALRVEDLVEVVDGLRVTIRRSKTDQTGQGYELPIPRGSKLRPVECVNAWLEASGITSGPLFRAVHVGGKVSRTALTPGAAARVVKAYAQAIGEDHTTYSGHSLRSGFLTSAAESGASLLRMADQSRHKSLDTLRGYVRRKDMWKDHGGGAFL